MPKRYDVVLDGPIPDGLAAAFASGSLRLAGELDPCRPAEVRPHVGGHPERVVVVLQEGRHRQVRRMFAHFGRQVVSLHREAVGSLELGGLEPGAWRSVSREEIGVGGAPGS